MSLIRYKPVPSDRMAAVWTLTQVRDAVVVDYGPVGTTTFARRKIGNMGVDTGNLVSTHLAEHDIIMGEMDRLERAVLAADEQRPPVIFVIPSTILIATGADIPGMCRSIEDRVQARLLSYGGYGSDGDYSKGLRAAYSLLVENLCPGTAETVPLSCNLLGLSASSPTAERDEQELRSLLERAFGAKTLLSLGMPCVADDFRRACGAAVNIVLRAEALDAARWMETTLGIPYVYEPPYGYAGTASFLNAVGEKLGRAPAGAVMDTLRRRQEEAAGRPPVAPLAVMGDYDLAAGLSRFALSLGGTVSAAICCHDLSAVEGDAGPVVYYETEKEWIDILRSLHRHLLIGDERLRYVAARDNTLLVASHGELAPENAFPGPFMGLAGADALMRVWSGR